MSVIPLNPVQSKSFDARLDDVEANMQALEIDYNNSKSDYEPYNTRLTAAEENSTNALTAANEAKGKVILNENRINNLFNAPTGKDLEVQDLRFDEVNNVQYDSANARVNKINESLNEKAKQDDILSQNLAFLKSFNGSFNVIGDSITANYGLSGDGYTDLLSDKLFSLNGSFRDHMMDVGFANDSLFSNQITGSWAYGTKGVIKKSIILQPNAVINVYGGYVKYLDIFYYKNPSAGQLEIRRNGVLIRTIDCSGEEEFDACTYPNASPEPSVFEAHTITCINAPVEITGIIRLESSPTDKVIHFNRFALAGTATANYTDQATLNSMLKMGGYSSSKRNIYMIALGTNDIYSQTASVSSTVYKTNLKKIAKWLIDNGNIVILTVPPISTNLTSEPFINYRDKAYEVADELGTLIIDYSLYDFSTKYIDGLHPNSDGHKQMYDIILKNLTFPGRINSPSGSVISKVEGSMKYGFIRNYWSLSEVIGNTAYDKANNKNGVITGTIRINGTFTNARQFNGTTDKIKIPFNIPLNDFTLLFNLPKVGVKTTNSFIFSSSVNADGDFGFGILKYSSSLKMYVNSSTIVTLCPLTSLTDGCRLALSITGGNATLYINGVAQTPVAVGTLMDKGVLNIGLGYTNWGFDGAIDEVAFCRLLTANEILQLAQSNSPLM